MHIESPRADARNEYIVICKKAGNNKAAKINLTKFFSHKMILILAQQITNIFPRDTRVLD